MEWDFEACGFNFCCNSSSCCGSGRCCSLSRSLRRAAVHAAGPIVASARSPSRRYFLFMPMCSARMPDGCQGNWGSLVLKIHTGSNPAPSAYQGDRRLGVGVWGVEISRPVPAISPVPGRQQDTSRRAQIFGLCWPPVKGHIHLFLVLLMPVLPLCCRHLPSGPAFLASPRCPSVD